MTISFIYWFLMLVWVLFSGWWGYRTDAAGRYPVWGSGLLIFLLFLLIGLRIFGDPIKG